VSSDLDAFDLFPKEALISELASVEDDLTDVSVYHQLKSPSSTTDYVLLDLSDGPKNVLQLFAIGYVPGNTAGNWYKIGPVTIDGTANDTFPISDDLQTEDNAGNVAATVISPPFRYDSTLKVEWEHYGAGEVVTVCSYHLGSGPYSIAVVQDGKPVYMTAENLSEETVEGMNVPSGYGIVRNPDISHPKPQSKGMWDDDRGEVVDHPYWKPFHETLDKLNAMSRRISVQDVLDKIEKNPTSFENVFQGELPRENPVEEAVQFWKEREEDRGLDLSKLEKMRG